MAVPVHKIIIDRHSAKLACGPRVSVLYQDGRADDYLIAKGDEKVTCDKCRAAIKLLQAVAATFAFLRDTSTTADPGLLREADLFIENLKERGFEIVSSSDRQAVED